MCAVESGEGACEKDEGKGEDKRGQMFVVEREQMNRERMGEENVCSGEGACKKDVKDEGGGGGERTNVCGGKSACDNDKGKGRQNVCGGDGYV